MQKIFIALSAFTDKGDDEELTKIDLRPPAPIPNLDLEQHKRAEPDVKETSGKLLTEDEVHNRYLDELNNHVVQATLEIGKRPDLRTRYQLRRVAQMSVRYENNTMPNENI